MSCFLAVCPKCGFIRLGNFADEDFNDDSSGKNCFQCKTPYINTDVIVNDYFNAFYDDDFEMMDLIEEKMNHKYVFNSLEYDEVAFAERQREVAIKRHKIIKKQEQNIPKCPICQSTNIHKISGTNKVGSALMFGVFAAGHVSKTFKCDSCGAKF